MSDQQLPRAEGDEAEPLEKQVEGTGADTEHEDATDTEKVPDAENPENTLDAESTENVADAENPENVPDAERPENDPAAENTEIESKYEAVANEENAQEQPDDQEPENEPQQEESEEELEQNQSSSQAVTPDQSTLDASVDSAPNDEFSFDYNSQADEMAELPEPHPLDELNDQHVIEVINECELESKHLALENILFESFLQENDPSQLEGLDDMLAYISRKTISSYVSTPSCKEIKDHPSIVTESRRFRLDSYSSVTSVAEGKGPKINLSHKTDMLMRAMEENQSGLESFLKKGHIMKRNLRAELEEFAIRESEILESTDIFEVNIVTQGIDKLTQRIPAEKFIRYMEEWLKSAQLQIEKLRLRIATLKVQYKKVSQQLIQRRELGENVHGVDFDQLEIENKHFTDKIEQKNIHLIELKKMNGGANLVLSTHKKFLQKQQEDCNQLKERLAAKHTQTTAAEKECVSAEEELNDVYDKYEQCKNLKSQYTVPEVMDYVRLKSKLGDLKKNIKIWERRRKIQDIALSACLREMKNLTGSVNIDPAWFEDGQTITSNDSFSVSSISLN